MGKTVLKYIFAFCSLLLFISCGKISSNFTNDEVDYSDSKCWFEANQEGMNKKVEYFLRGAYLHLGLYRQPRANTT